jgi:small-conductance mechanosensitive channel
MEKILDFALIKYGTFKLTVGSLFVIILIFVFARLFIFSINKILKRYLQRKNIDYGRSYAVRTIFKYLVYIIAAILILKTLGVQLSVLLLGSAGLLVGIGIGLQQTFSDFISGIILLVEGNIEVGDIMDIDGIIGQVTRIGLRNCSVKTREDFTIIIPNSKLVGHSTINWTHNESPSRFAIDFGVSYDSDIDKVERIALDIVKKDEDVVAYPVPSVQLVNFGESSVDFKLLFFSDEFFYIERVKSNIRKMLFKALKNNGIEIPYPQRDIRIKETKTKGL